jgi:hypothetical protein
MYYVIAFTSFLSHFFFLFLALLCRIRWVYTAAPLLLEAQDASNLQVTDLNNLCTAVIDASNVISLISDYYQTQGNSPSSSPSRGKGIRTIVSAIRNFVLSDVDEKNISDTQVISQF